MTDPYFDRDRVQSSFRYDSFTVTKEEILDRLGYHSLTFRHFLAHFGYCFHRLAECSHQFSLALYTIWLWRTIESRVVIDFSKAWSPTNLAQRDWTYSYSSDSAWATYLGF